MDHNYFKGTDGYEMNSILAACSFNLRKFPLAYLRRLFKELERFQLLLRLFKIFVERPVVVI